MIETGRVCSGIPYTTMLTCHYVETRTQVANLLQNSSGLASDYCLRHAIEIATLLRRPKSDQKGWVSSVDA